MERWLEESGAVALGAVVVLPLLWMAAGGLLRWFERWIDRNPPRDERLIRGRVTRPFVWDETEREHRGRVRVGVEIWRARCSPTLAESIEVGDRVWLSRHHRVLQVDRTEG